jgi:DNA-directed RNA polymerase specialized sigma24 family protein
LESVRLGAPLEEVARGLQRGNSSDDFRNPLESELERSKVLLEIPRLPEELRAVMELHVVEGLGKNATARRLGTHRQTVRNQINRAWDEIRDRIYAAESPTVSAPWGETMEKEAVAKALPRLPEELRAVMEPCLREKIGVNELARRLGWYAATVSKRLRRAWKALREELNAARAPIDLRAALGCTEGKIMVLRIAV